MKIAFLVGGLEPGRNGVGDYSRILAEDLTRLGHECRLVSLHDEAITQTVEAPVDVTPNGGPSISPLLQLRLPQTLPWAQRTEYARRFLDDFSPDWVSLQFVPYAFNARGLVQGLGAHLRPLVQGRRVHIMFHETWIGEGDWTFKQKLVGIAQRKLVLKLVHTLRPQVVHTSNAIFLEQLKRRQIIAKPLQLFGNMPVTNHSGDSWLLPQLQAQGLSISPEERKQWWLFGFFGSVYKEWPPEPLFTYIKEAAQERGKRVAIVSAGRQGDETVWKNLSDSYPNFSFAVLGPLPGERISEYFNSLDFGIAASTYAFIGKSGSALTMLEHGLPLIVNRDDWKMAGTLSPEIAELRRQIEANTPTMIKMGDDFAARLKAGLPRTHPRPFLREVAEQMLSDLQATSQ